MGIRKTELNFAVVIGNYSDEPCALMCTDKTLRILYETIYPEIKGGDFVMFVDGENDPASIVIPLSEFRYFNRRGKSWEQFDETIYNRNGTCVPKALIKDNDKFFVDNGNGSQFVCYCKKENFVLTDWLNKADEIIIRSYFNQHNIASNNEIFNELKQIDNYLSNLDVNAIINSFTIENEESFISRPGKDDYYCVCKVDSKIDESYINTLFPHRSKKIYEDHGFIEAHKMNIHPQRRGYLEEEKSFIQDAKSKYNQEEHRRYLIGKYIDDILHKQKLYYEDMISLYYIDIQKKVRSYNYNHDFIIQYNNFIRKYQY